ncbi:hypothetical protein J41TS4_26490 [Paenibacillus apis]|uniref:Uncharacterized protein n=1 Tax=Paenibacillus apis TaxID=1792174 RepID=A0A919Y0Z0_9BACL|nr:hypothetical protein J41TS4_26490 [Paenibacillus apis]
MDSSEKTETVVHAQKPNFCRLYASYAVRIGDRKRAHLLKRVDDVEVQCREAHRPDGNPGERAA